MLPEIVSALASTISTSPLHATILVSSRFNHLFQCSIALLNHFSYQRRERDHLDKGGITHRGIYLRSVAIQPTHISSSIP